MKKKIIISILGIILAIIVGYLIAVGIGFERHVHFWVLNSLDKTVKISFENTTIEGEEEYKKITDKEDITTILKAIKNSKKKVSFNQGGLCNGPAYELNMYDKNDELIDTVMIFLNNDHESYKLGRDKSSGCGGGFINKDKDLSVMDIIIKTLEKDDE